MEQFDYVVVKCASDYYSAGYLGMQEIRKIFGNSLQVYNYNYDYSDDNEWNYWFISMNDPYKLDHSSIIGKSSKIVPLISFEKAREIVFTVSIGLPLSDLYRQWDIKNEC